MRAKAGQSISDRRSETQHATRAQCCTCVGSGRVGENRKSTRAMPRAPGARLGVQVWLFPQIRPCGAPRSLHGRRPVCQSVSLPLEQLGLGPADAIYHDLCMYTKHSRLGEVWRQDPASIATMTHRPGDIPERSWPTVTIMPVRLR